ncbi:adenosine A2a receptor b [Limanda limanda]|uniref:adenosine A2a receptor b n=1 Tax=Limanda limanda TaxID=27771 RepID=UPI0029C6AFAE|nr:adenosine A2a receptor b [Limanda limanda]
MLKTDQLVYIVLELVIACLAVAGNILVCWAVCLNSNLQTITNFFLVSLAVADIAVGLLAIPFAISISTGFCANFYGCLFIACFVLVLTQSSIFSLLAIAVDRCIAIKNPLRYNSLVTGQRAKGIITLCWVLSVGIGLTPMLGWNTGSDSKAAGRTNSSCPNSLCECLFEGVVTMDYMVYFNFFCCVLVPLLVMLVIYANIFLAAQHQLRMIGFKASHMPALAVITSAASSSPRSTLQKEVHAAKSLSIIVGMFAFCWLPVHIINCFNHMCPDCERPHIWVMNIAIILSHANSVMNPFIYAYRIREFRETFRRILSQHILGHGDMHGLGDGRGAGSSRSSIVRTSSSSRTSKESSCGTVVNSYIVDPGSKQTIANQETSCHWTAKLDSAPGGQTPNFHQIRSSSLTQQLPCIMGFAAQEGKESDTYFGGTTDASELKNNGSGITFVNVHAGFLKQTDCTCSAELTQVS